MSFIDIFEHNGQPTYLHGLNASFSRLVARHALEAGTVELKGRERPDGDGTSKCNSDVRICGFGGGWLYTIATADDEDIAWSYAQGGYVFVLGRKSDGDEEPIVEHSIGTQEFVLPLSSYEVIAMLDEDGGIWEPVEWAEMLESEEAA